MRAHRPCHILQENASRQGPQEMIFFDTETHMQRVGVELEHTLYLIVAIYLRFAQGAKSPQREEVRKFETCEEFWKWVVSKVHGKSALYMVAHNISFDLITSKGLLLLPLFGFRLKKYYEKGYTFHVAMSNGKANIHLINLANFYQGSLKEIGQSFGLEKLEIDYQAATAESAYEYCLRDVEIVKAAFLGFLQFVKDNDLGHFSLTISSQAFAAFRHRFMHSKIYIHNNERALELERESYYGGRTEMFFKGKVKEKPIFALDVNSMYPSVMQDNLFPSKLVKVLGPVLPHELKKLLAKYLVIAKVRVKTSVPCVPVRVNKRLVFPVGEFITTLCTPELDLILQHGEIEEVLEVAIYQGERLFSDYVSWFYQQRLNAKRKGDLVKNLLYKLFMNSLYGKFGQKAHNWKIIGPCPPNEISTMQYYDASTGQRGVIKRFAGQEIESQEERESFNSFPAIAAFVTSYARSLLFRYILQAGWENVFYCDTDSLFVNTEGLRRLQVFIAKDVLGALKISRPIVNLELFGAKDYIYDGVEVHKGIPKGAKKLKENIWSVEIWPHLATHIRNGDIGKYKNKILIKVLTREYEKGYISSQGKVIPYVLRIGELGNEIVPFQETGFIFKEPAIPI